MSRTPLVVAVVSVLAVVALTGCTPGAEVPPTAGSTSSPTFAGETEAADEGSRKPGPIERPYVAPECKAVSAAAVNLIDESLATDSAGAPMELERPIASWSESDNAWLVSGSVTIHTGRDQPIAFFATKAYLPAEEVPDVTAADFSGELFAANGTASQYSSLPARVYAVSENGARGALGCSH